MLLFQRGKNPIDADVKQIVVIHELPPEPEQRVFGRDAIGFARPRAADDPSQSVVLLNEPDYARPDRDAVEMLYKHHADLGPNSIARAPGPAGAFQIFYERPNLGRIENSPKLACKRDWYVG